MGADTSGQSLLTGHLRRLLGAGERTPFRRIADRPIWFPHGDTLGLESGASWGNREFYQSQISTITDAGAISEKDALSSTALIANFR